jgi:hypothetical protein
MRPMLRPGLAVAWRSPGSLHLGVGDPDPVVVSGLSTGARSVLALMDGTRTVAQLVAQATGCHPLEVYELVEHLIAARALIDAGRWPGGMGAPAARRERLLPDLMASAPSDPDRWWDSLSRAHVTVVGASRLGAITARALAESGIGRVSVDDPRTVTLADVALGGFGIDDVGTTRSALLHAHPGPPSPRAKPDAERQLVVLTDAVDVDVRARALTARGAAYLVVSCRERLGWVGPFHEPGRSPCHFCVELHRRDRDPSWPDVWRQRTWDASPVALASVAAITAHAAASHVVAWAVDEAVPSMHGVIEIGGDAGGRTWPTSPHPECGCTWTSLAS